MKKFFPALFSALLCLSFQASADTSDLISGCEIALDRYENPKKDLGLYGELLAGHCMGFIDGVVNTANEFSTGLDPDLKFCASIDKRIKTKSLVQAVVSYGHDHPETKDSNDHRLVLLAMADKFPCSSSIKK